jgi:hypothetical protein
MIDGYLYNVICKARQSPRNEATLTLMTRAGVDIIPLLRSPTQLSKAPLREEVHGLIVLYSRLDASIHTTSRFLRQGYEVARTDIKQAIEKQRKMPSLPSWMCKLQEAAEANMARSFVGVLASTCIAAMYSECYVEQRVMRAASIGLEHKRCTTGNIWVAAKVRMHLSRVSRRRQTMQN